MSLGLAGMSRLQSLNFHWRKSGEQLAIAIPRNPLLEQQLCYFPTLHAKIIAQALAVQAVIEHHDV
jgi:hypothetical protein